MHARLPLLVALLLAPMVSHANGTARVAVVDPDQFEQPGGIARWLEARAKLDGERAKFKLVESPDGKSPQPPADLCKNPPAGLASERLKKLCDDLRTMGLKHVEDQAWNEHEAGVLDPIERDVNKELEKWARGKGIGLLLFRSDAMIVIDPVADVTRAFIAHYNASARPRKP